MKIKERFNSRAILKKDEIIKYKDNLDVSEYHSFFNEESQIICIKFPVPKKTYEVRNIYNFSNQTKNRIVIHITDFTNDRARGQGRKKDFMISGIFNFSDILNTSSTSLNLNSDSSLTVLIYNENSLLTADIIKNEIDVKYFIDIENNSQFDSFKNIKGFDEPNEAGGGGVIVKGP